MGLGLTASHEFAVPVWLNPAWLRESKTLQFSVPEYRD